MNSEPYEYAVSPNGKCPCAETESADRRKAVIDRGGARDHAMLGPFDASRAGELGFLVDRESFGQPRRRIRVWEKQRRAAEDLLAERPNAARAVEMKDVRQLVRDDELCPVIRVAKRGLRHRRIGVDDDAVRRRTASRIRWTSRRRRR